MYPYPQSTNHQYQPQEQKQIEEKPEAVLPLRTGIFLTRTNEKPLFIGKGKIVDITLDDRDMVMIVLVTGLCYTVKESISEVVGKLEALGN